MLFIVLKHISYVGTDKLSSLTSLYAMPSIMAKHKQIIIPHLNFSLSSKHLAKSYPIIIKYKAHNPLRIC